MASILTSHSSSSSSLNYRTAVFLKTRGQNFALLSAAVAIVATVLYLFDPAVVTIYPPSSSRLLLGIYCPGCGTLRGLHQLLHGNLGKAFGFNPLMVLLLPYLVYTYLHYGIPVFTRRKSQPLFVPPTLIRGLLSVILIYWFLRNMPFPIFSWMAP